MFILLHVWLHFITLCVSQGCLRITKYLNQHFQMLGENMLKFVFLTYISYCAQDNIWLGSLKTKMLWVLINSIAFLLPHHHQSLLHEVYHALLMAWEHSWRVKNCSCVKVQKILLFKCITHRYVYSHNK